MIKELSLNFCTSLGIGYLTKFPGTFASFIILFPLWFLLKLDILFLISGLIFLIIISFFTVKCVLRDIKDKDPSYIVIDEYIGQSIAILFCEQNILEFVSAFFLFRFFDIIKPFPINYFDKQNTPFGLLMDDVTAGLIAGIITYFFFKI